MSPRTKVFADNCQIVILGNQPICMVDSVEKDTFPNMASFAN